MNSSDHAYNMKMTSGSKSLSKLFYLSWKVPLFQITIMFGTVYLWDYFHVWKQLCSKL
jgi:hypothetical protein